MDLVLNWLWQGVVIALVAAAALRTISPCRPQARYAVAWAASLAIVALPLMTLVWALVAAVPAAAVIPPPPAPVLSIPAAWWTSTEVAFGLWIAWMAVYICRVGLDAIAVWQTKRSCRVFPPAREAGLPCWSRIRSNGRQAQLMISDRVRAAGMLGGANPVIAIAPELLELSDADLDCIAVHEWAHVQRRDDVARVAQVVVQTIAGWHPALLWLERHLHIEREASCDLATVEVVGSAKDYAACLARIASLAPGSGRSVAALAAASSTGLRHRIIRILTKSAPASRSWQMTAIATAVIVTIVAFGIGRLRLVDTASAGIELLETLGVQASATTTAADVIAKFRTDGRAVRRPSSASATPVTARFAPTPAPASAPNEKTSDTERPQATTLEAQATLPDAQLPVTPLVPSPGPVSESSTVSADTALVVSNSTPVPAVPAPADTPIWTTAANTGKAAANTGKAVGRESEGAARATAGLFTRFGKKIAASF